MIMRRFVIAILCALMFAASCQTAYRDEYPHLRVDRTYLKIPSDAGSIAIMVYYSGSWTAALDEECDWASLDRRSGSGISAIHLEFGQNLLEARETSLTLSGGADEPVTITITQNAGI